MGDRAAKLSLWEGCFATTAEELEWDFRRGDKTALIDAIFLALFRDEDIPEWARDALINAYVDRPKSWDDAFGPPLPEGTHADQLRIREANEHKVFEVVARLNETQGISDKLFREVGEELGMSGGSVKGIYYDEGARRRFCFGQLLDEAFTTLAADIGKDPDGAMLARWVRQNKPALAKVFGDYTSKRSAK